jgi:MinD superfamily P-loop ATPase
VIVSIASGKGGTGKTTVALLLAAARESVTVIDCDVEEPNCHLFLQPEWQDTRKVSVMIPQIDTGKCSGCGRCTEACLFNALAVAGKSVISFEELCHSCGGCLLACPSGAISETAKTIGAINSGTARKAAPGKGLISGSLNVGMPAAGPLIKAMKQSIPAIGDVIVDCPPGTSCSMVAGVTGSDVCLLVTEPTPFGLHDLNSALGVVKLLGIPAGVVINKSDAGPGDAAIVNLCGENGVEIYAKIPHSREFAAKYSEGIIPEDFCSIAAAIWEKLVQDGDSQ